MKKVLSVLLVALLMAGCGGEQSAEDLNEKDNKASAKAPFVEKWAEWEANATPYGGLEALAKIRKAKESGATELNFHKSQITDLTPLTGLTKLTKLVLGDNQITDLSPLAGLTNLEALHLGDNRITDLTPLAKLTKMQALTLYKNQVTDVSTLAGLTKLKELGLSFNQITDQQKAMLKKALPNCQIWF